MIDPRTGATSASRSSPPWNGITYAGELEWACFADVRVADERAFLGVTLAPLEHPGSATASCSGLPRVVGMGRAVELIIAGRGLNTSRQRRSGCGSVDEGGGGRGSVEGALELAEAIASYPRRSAPTGRPRCAARPPALRLRIKARCWTSCSAWPRWPREGAAASSSAQTAGPRPRPGAPVASGLARGGSDGWSGWGNSPLAADAEAFAAAGTRGRSATAAASPASRIRRRCGAGAREDRRRGEAAAMLHDLVEDTAPRSRR